MSARTGCSPHRTVYVWRGRTLSVFVGGDTFEKQGKTKAKSQAKAQRGVIGQIQQQRLQGFNTVQRSACHKIKKPLCECRQIMIDHPREQGWYLYVKIQRGVF